MRNGWMCCEMFLMAFDVIHREGNDEKNDFEAIVAWKIQRKMHFAVFCVTLF